MFVSRRSAMENEGKVMISSLARTFKSKKAVSHLLTASG